MGECIDIEHQLVIYISIPNPSHESGYYMVLNVICGN